jgi:hypothetical protein
LDSRFDVGDIIELIPENFPDDWYEGIGLILDIVDGNYYVHIYSLVKTSRKKLTVIMLGEQRMHFPVNEADENGYFRLLA